MPVDFLTAEQTQQYGRFAGDPSPAQLGKYFFLDNKDRNEVCIRRGAHNRLGYALQLCTVRFLGTFLADPLAVPRLVVHHLARQLEIDDASCLSQYVERRHTPLEHAQEIRQRHGYGDFGEQPEHWRLVRWLYRRAWLTAERPVVLFDLATARLVERRILLPGATTLARLVATVRDRAAGRLWRTLAEIPSSEQRQQLGTLLAIQEQGHSSLLEELRQPAVNVSAPGMVDAFTGCLGSGIWASLHSTCRESRLGGCEPWPAMRQRLGPKALRTCNPVVVPRRCWHLRTSTRERRKMMRSTFCTSCSRPVCEERRGKVKWAVWKRWATWTPPL